MGTDKIIVREYLESLSEDRELDNIFPILLNLMGYKIVSTPRDSKGQSQYGKDVIAVKVDTDGIKKRFFFELKGHVDKDINDEVFSKKDGIRDSLLAAKYADFVDTSIPGFSTLPKKIVLVHNGILKANTRPTFDGFVKHEFPDGNFERWDIHTLSDWFSEFVFGEYLLTDKENVTLFKRTLVLLTTPEYDLVDFKRLTANILTNDDKTHTRRFQKMFATIRLLAYILHHYSKENNNLEPAKQGISYLLLQTWSWILSNKLDTKPAVLHQFSKLLDIQYRLLSEYFEKTLPIAYETDGLFSERGGPFETVGYPLRAMEYINYLVYYFELRHRWPQFDKKERHIKDKRLFQEQQTALFKILDANDGCVRPLLDKYYITMVLVLCFCKKYAPKSNKIRIELSNYLVSVFDNIILIYKKRNRFPEFHDNLNALIEFSATGKRPNEYDDSSSHLLLAMAELCAIIGNEDLYHAIREHLQERIDLQSLYPTASPEEFELSLFTGNNHEFLAVETSIKLPEKIHDFVEQMKNKPSTGLLFKTDKAGFPFLRILSSIVYSNDILPFEWRKYYPA